MLINAGGFGQGTGGTWEPCSRSELNFAVNLKHFPKKSIKKKSTYSMFFVTYFNSHFQAMDSIDIE